jgi:hypothetical protein
VSELRRSAAAYLGMTLLCLVVLFWVFKLGKADLSVPLAYGGDALHTLLWVKGLFENGWYLTNPSVGAPSAWRCMTSRSPMGSSFCS